MYLLIGILGFLLCALFDMNRISCRKRQLSLLFPLGSVLIVGSTVYCIWSQIRSGLEFSWTTGRILMASGGVLSLGLLVYTLFFALPLGDTYGQTEDVPVITGGVYGLCRHPGFWPFAACYGFLAALMGTGETAVCAVLFSLANLAYIVLQDVFIFPRYIRGYGEYKKQVPFLIPTASSIRKVFRS